MGLVTLLWPSFHRGTRDPRGDPMLRPDLGL